MFTAGVKHQNRGKCALCDNTHGMVVCDKGAGLSLSEAYDLRFSHTTVSGVYTVIG